MDQVLGELHEVVHEELHEVVHEGHRQEGQVVRHHVVPIGHELIVWPGSLPWSPADTVGMKYLHRVGVNRRVQGRRFRLSVSFMAFKVIGRSWIAVLGSRCTPRGHRPLP